jgi:glycerol-3-phosphate dehydrogenase
MGMRRDLSGFLDKTFDLLVVGAGIHGACIAWDACLRGLSVALVDRGDFGAATSANSLRIVHGGLRYLARGDLGRMRESIRERSALLRIAPTLVEPLPVLIPTYRGLTQGRGAMRAALLANDLVSWERNRRLRPDRVIPRGRLVSRGDTLKLFPWFRTEELTGGALWYDARLRDPERLTLSFVSSAADRGAVTANYVRLDQLVLAGGEAQGATVTDLERGAQFDIRSRVVVVAAGPWTQEVIAGTLGHGMGRPRAGRALAVNAILDRPLADLAVGSRVHNDLEVDPVFGGPRFLFAAPLNGRTLLGTWYATDDQGNLASRLEQCVENLVRGFNRACPGVELSAGDIAGWQWGWLPLKSGLEPGRPAALAERPRVIDHGRADRVPHLLSVEGVKYTTARRVAERAVDWVFNDLGRATPPCRTAEVLLKSSDSSREPESKGTLDQAKVSRAIHEEMAVKLSDIVLRRLGLGGHGELTRTTVADVAQLAGAELGWSAMRQQAEVEDVIRQTRPHAQAEEPVG